MIDTNFKHLADYLPRQTYGIMCGYQKNEIISVVAGVTISDDDSLWLQFPKVNPFHINQKITIHLDDRTGVEVYTHDFRVYRCSYKGIVSEESNNGIKVIPEEFTLRYSNNTVIGYRDTQYQYPLNVRENIKPGISRITGDILPNINEQENKLGVWITKAPDRPHTTVMAFLSSKNDDIFVISHNGTFKSSLIHKDSACMFAIDHRASYNFERKYEWNYTLVKAKAGIVERSDKAFVEIQAMFVEKNPWELLFFTDPRVEMFHLEPIEIMYPEKLANLTTL
jgi:hypothetical protein